MATYVLVHGAWQGGWAWKKVIPALRAAGHEVFAPTLTGLGERAHLGHEGIDLDTHIDDVVGVLEAEELLDIVLVGHSYGGSVVTGVAERQAERISALVYLDAFVPGNGESSFTRMDKAQAASIRKAAEEKGGGWRVPGRPAAVHKIRNDNDAAWFDRHTVGHPIGCMEQPITHTDPWTRIASLTFIHCTENAPSPFGSIAARLIDDPAWTLRTLACGHIAMIDMPAELTDILLSVAS